MEDILKHRYQGSRRQYLVRWKGYDANEDTWLKEDDFGHAKEVLKAYKRRSGLETS